jgi:hypothetical protein
VSADTGYHIRVTVHLLQVARKEIEPEKGMLGLHDVLRYIDAAIDELYQELGRFE